ncbi:hypothetical protein [Streptococcus sp. 263_SSPC]|jgi:hypothetical protein|uniref:hypothetical protein n=1 Tax=Streptococcus sp. 263_SSPC TaxID=1579343 RepID=UPI0006613C5A|nr:hypothetical protein [Streptococcus sp. 263_SSPC]
MKNEISIEKLIAEETKRRLDLMEDKDYIFPERFSKMDYLWAGICVGVNLILIILAMCGVIQ